MLRFRKSVNFIRPIRRVETEAQKPFLDEFARYLKIMFPAGIGLYAGYYFLTVPVVGRSMSPQFNPQFADYGDTVLYLPRVLKSEPLKRGKCYIFNDPTKA